MKRKVFHVAGAILVAFWIVMIGLLVSGRGLSDTSCPVFPMDIPAIQTNQQEWMEVLLGSDKVGYSVSAISRIDTGYIIREELVLRLRLMGIARTIHTTSSAVVDDQFIIKRFQFQIDSGLVSFKVSGKVEGGWLLLERGEGKNKNVRKIRLKSQPVSSAAIPFILRAKKLQLGESTKISVFEPSSLAQMEIPIKAVSKEDLFILGHKYGAVKYEGEMMGHTVYFWMTEDGKLLKQSGLMGLTLVRSNAKHAPMGIGEGNEEELYDIVAVVPDKAIARPRRLRVLKLRIKGISPREMSLEPSDARQALDQDILTIRTETIPRPRGREIGLSPNVREEVRKFLKPELNIESGNELIKEKAREIVRGAKRPVARARRLMHWVYLNVEKRPVIGIPSAVQTLKNLEGDCNEHSALLAALLRASGIPARVCAGLVYAKGKFFYHSWNEAFLAGKWITMDATLDQMPVDATHIKLVHGGLDKQMQIIRLMGRLKLEILEGR
ncbi:MAG: hypothetical protein DRH12_15380 [Deltaproteobacteria bacterium]|nr:MAG: hypothetical protein DRH12_15380 [Deltaproteobacteria bacterium]